MSKLFIVILSLLFAAVQFTNGDQIQFDASQLSNCTYAQICVYSWNSGKTWIGGRAPSPADDVEINIGNNIVAVTCDNNCVAKNVRASGKQLTFRLTSATSATFEQINATSGIINFEGGSLTVKDFVKPHGTSIISQYKNMQATIENMEVTALALMISTVQIGTATIDSFQLIDSQFTNQHQANLFDILSIESSAIIFQGGCSVPDHTATRIINSTIFTTPSCPLIFNSLTIFYNSKWTIESPQPTPLTISSPFDLKNSTVKLTRVKLAVRSSIRMYQNSVIDSDLPIEVSYNGRIGGQGSVMSDLAVKNFGRIEFNYGLDEGLVQQIFTVVGALSLDRSSTVHLQHAESIQANSILVADASLEISFMLYNWNWTFGQQLNYTLISAQQGEISGSFDFINVTMANGYYQFMKTKSDLVFIWQYSQPAPPVAAPGTVVPITAGPTGSSAPTNGVIPPGSSEPNSSSDSGTDVKVVVIVIESVMLALGLVLAGLLLYRRFIKRRNYTQVPSFDQL